MATNSIRLQITQLIKAPACGRAEWGSTGQSIPVSHVGNRVMEVCDCFAFGCHCLTL